MADSDSLKPLQNISNEIDNSQVKISIYSNCTKAQKFLLDKLRKETERQKEIIKFLSSSNFKLETEIKLAEQKNNSLNVAIETIKLGNIELYKEQLLSKERQADILERTKLGRAKYENMWLAAKERHESIPIVKELVEVKNKNRTVQANINAFMDESKHMVDKIRDKKNDLAAIDRARIIKLADFLVTERTKMLIKINENNAKIKEVADEIQMLEHEASKNCNVFHEPSLPKDREEAVESAKDSVLEDKECKSKTSDDPLMWPKLQVQNNDLHIISINLDQIYKADSQSTSMKRPLSSTFSDLENYPHKMQNIGQRDNTNYISSYFNISMDNSDRHDDNTLHTKNYSENKLIHILENIALDKKETYNIIKTLEVDQLRTTNCITSNNSKKISNTEEEINKSEQDQKNKPMETEEIEEIETPETREEDVVDPPSQFVDIPQNQNSQEKKTVSFNIPNDMDMSTSLEEIVDNSKENYQSQQKILNHSTTSDDSYSTIKDKILKNRNLDLSPQFVYSKNTSVHKQQQENITSNFFENQNEIATCSVMNDNDCNKIIKQSQILKCDENKLNLSDNEIGTEDKTIIISSPKAQISNLEMPVSGFLFNHGPQGISDSLNLSISTTGYEDNEDYPRCIDSSVLLSPKADIPTPVSSSHNNEVLSQDVPNFLGGFRKTASLFFGGTSSSNSKPETVVSQSGGFNFTFSNEEKKGRGGFFSMFH